MRSTRLLAVSALAAALVAPASAAAEAPARAEPFSKAAVARVVAEHQDEIQDCYEDALAAKNANRRQARGGRVTMAWTIAPAGNVRDVKVQRTTLGDRAVTSCIADAIAAWEFPAPARPQPIVFPFDLRPVSSDGAAKQAGREGGADDRG